MPKVKVRSSEGLAVDVSSDKPFTVEEAARLAFAAQDRQLPGNWKPVIARRGKIFLNEQKDWPDFVDDGDTIFVD